MRRVWIESPHAGEVDRHVMYGRACVKDSLGRNEAPVSFDLLYSQPGILYDISPSVTSRSTAAGFSFFRKGMIDDVVIYHDLGVTKGMEKGINRAFKLGMEPVWRSLPGFSSGFYMSPPSLIKAAVCQAFRVRPLALVGHSRQRPLSRARFACSWLLKKHTGLSYEGMGKELGNKDHTSILHGITRADEMIERKDEHFTGPLSEAEEIICGKQEKLVSV